MPESLTSCLCCGQSLSASKFTPGAQVCTSCKALDIETAVRMTRHTMDFQHMMQARTKQGRRQVKRIALQAKLRETGKRCTSCHAFKPPDQYAVCEARLDGLQPECKPCSKIRASLLATPGGRDAWYATRDALRAQASKAASTGRKRVSK